jgi:catechol 2,3-dioxygenase-like lactoylglutathione lyase family enzyme
MRTSLTGLTLHVADVERSRDFYTRLPGAVLVHHRPGDFALFQLGEGRLGLLSARFLPKGAPAFHMEVSSTLEDIDALHDQVLAAGLEPDGPPANRSWGERTFHLSDPDGNRIEFDSRLD